MSEYFLFFLLCALEPAMGISAVNVPWTSPLMKGLSASSPWHRSSPTHPLSDQYPRRKQTGRIMGSIYIDSTILDLLLVLAFGASCLLLVFPSL
ncbi:hypothetical protein BDV41DRAFT_555304 [Aspergillus transmontanensis]|uniref:Uncharacterized protein n=1 Tax=Aspergillus transmontanensis TaxID=1034304 RepID=A0A5N6VGL5_9EURO|nr:hypothetical protein BDV41DRAFT_555304 [Aspergillus transmontanensis]